MSRERSGAAICGLLEARAGQHVSERAANVGLGSDSKNLAASKMSPLVLKQPT
jgi:hypothetical protein